MSRPRRETFQTSRQSNLRRAASRFICMGGNPANLLRRHVADRAHHRPRLGFGGRRSLSWGRWFRSPSRQAEVENLYAAVGGEKNVLRLQVPVDDALGMRGGQTVGNGGP